MTNRRLCAAAFVCLIGPATICPAQTGQDATARPTTPPISVPATQPSHSDDGPVPVAVRWWGQACVSIETFWGFTIVVDPFVPDERMGYPRPDLSADLALITHEHFDHAGVESIQGRPTVLHGLTSDGNWTRIDHVLDRRPNQPQAKVLPHAEAGTPSSHAVHIKGIPTFHDSNSGAKRGKNTMFLIEADGLRILHCGDLGHELTAEQIAAVGPVDLLLIPVGGTYTIDAAGALAVTRQLKPRRWIWPIHFKTSAVKIPLAPLDPFLAQARTAGMTIREIKGHTVAAVFSPPDTTAGTTPPTVIVADFKPVRPKPEVERALEAVRTERQALIDALGKVSKPQLDHKPSDGTHTIRWNFEHTAGAEFRFFSQIYHALDPQIPVFNWGPAQMPPDYQPRHPDWDTAEMVRHVQRAGAFTARFSYLLADMPADQKIEGTRFSAQSLCDLLVDHYRNHATKAVRKFQLPDWPRP